MSVVLERPPADEPRKAWADWFFKVWVVLDDPTAGTGVTSTRTLTAGSGLTGGGDLSADRTFNVGAGNGITVNADDIEVDTSIVALAATDMVAGSGMTGGGTIASSRTFNVIGGDGITANADDIEVDEAFQFNWTGVHIHTDDVEFGADGSSEIDIDFFTVNSGKGLQWRPGASDTDPVFNYIGETNKGAHVKFQADLTQNVTSGVLFEGLYDLDSTSGGKSSAIIMDFNANDNRVIDDLTGPSADVVRTFKMTVTRSATYDNDQQANLGTTLAQGLHVTLNDSGTYSKTTGTQNPTFGFMKLEHAFDPDFSATSGSNSFNVSGIGLTGTFNSNGNAQTSFEYNFIDFNTSYVQLSGLFGFGAGGTFRGFYYHPSAITVISGGAVTEAAFEASRSGIKLASDYTKNTDSTGFLRMGAGGDAEIGYDGSHLILESQNVGSGDVQIPSGNLDAVNDVRCRQTICDGDNAGVASTVSFTNGNPALGGGAAPTLGTIGGSGPATAAQNSWIKIYIGTTAAYIPVWT